MVGCFEKVGYVEIKLYKGVRLIEDGLMYMFDIIKRY